MPNSFITILEQEIWSREGREEGEEIRFLCPSHDDHNPSARYNPAKEVWYCDVCKDGGGATDLAQKLEIEVNSTPTTGYTPAREGCSLEDYAKRKGLSVSFLEKQGLTDSKFFKNKALKIPYFDESGVETSVRYRINLEGKNRFRWKKGSQPILYGLWKIKDFNSGDPIVLVEGESDCHTLWSYEIPALGLPSASIWVEEWSEYFKKFPKIFVWKECDAGGDSVLKWLEKSSLKEKAYIVSSNEFKDPSEIHSKGNGNFESIFKSYLNSAQEFNEGFREAIRKEREQCYYESQEIVSNPNILELISRELNGIGFVGEHHFVKILFLSLNTRFFNKLVSVAVKGPSSSGKSFTVQTALKFFPPSAYCARSAFSEKALIYSEESLIHRFLILYEAAGLGTDNSQYFIRTLLSEGRLSYETVEKTSKGLRPRKIEKEGPTGLIVTTTSINLHSENETRLLSLTINDSPEHTAEVLVALARRDNYLPENNFKKWHSFQRWLDLGNKKIIIPFAETLARLIPPVAVRLRRDFSHILSLIESHALIHQANRAIDKEDNLIATIDDYAAIRDLIKDLLSEGVGASVPETVRETVNAVAELCSDGISRPISIQELGAKLHLEDSSVRRRVHRAINLGYLINNAPKLKPLEIGLGEKMPDETSLLPTPEELLRKIREEGGGFLL